MSTTHTDIGEYDVVVLVNAVDGWPAGTKGTVVDVHPPHKTVEIEGIEQSDDDMLEYLPMVADEDLRLVSKCPPSAD
jgi:ribosomal protein L24